MRMPRLAAPVPPRGAHLGILRSVPAGSVFFACPDGPAPSNETMRNVPWHFLLLSSGWTIALGQNQNDPFTANPTACAMPDSSQSNGWTDSATNVDHFSTRIVVKRGAWLPQMHFTVTWASFATVDHAYGVVPYTEAADSGDGHSATFELPVDQAANLPPNDMLPAFVLMGRDTSEMPLSITCSNEVASTAVSTGGVPRPVSASADECSLGAQWKLTNPYAQLSDAEVRMGSWETGRIVTLSFYGELLEFSNVRFATIEDTVENGFDTVVSFRLGGGGTGQACNTGHVDQHGVFVRDVSCGLQGGGPEGDKVFTFQMAPSPKNAPRIGCNDESPPPPPPSAGGVVPSTSQPQDQNSASGLHPRAPMVAGGAFSKASSAEMHAGTLVEPPPPVPARGRPSAAPLRVESDAACHAGGSAEVMQQTKNGDIQTMRIHVKPTFMWPTGYGYVLGIKGLDLEIARVDGAVQIAKRPGHVVETGLDALHSFIFLPRPSTTNFGFDVTGVDIILVSLTCE
jgi:hypothetical protein